MGGLAEASSRSREGPLPSIFLDQTEDNSAKKILFWIELLHTLRSGWVVPPRHLKVWWESSRPTPLIWRFRSATVGSRAHIRAYTETLYYTNTICRTVFFFRNLSICLPALVIVITKLQEVWPEVNYVFFTIVNAWNQLTHKITRWLTDLNCICTLFVNVTIMFILGSSVIIIQMAKTSIFRPFLFWSIHLILSYPNRYFATNKLYKAVAVL